MEIQCKSSFLPILDLPSQFHPGDPAQPIKYKYFLINMTKITDE